jgi:putative oxidoreductase
MKFSVMEKQSIPDTLKTIPTTLKETVVPKRRQESSMMMDLGLLTLRLTVGGLLAGHGSQKLFGWFSGPGMKGTAGWLESIGLKPGTAWASGASASEFGGGVLTSLGFLHPLGPLGTIGAMVMATAKAHWGKPIWAAQGGAELPVTNIGAALALTLTGPGRFSLDNLFDIRLPRGLVIAAATVEVVMLAIGIMSRPAPPQASPAEQQATTAATAS